MESQEERLRAYRQQMIDEEREELMDNAALIKSFKEYCLSKGIVLNDDNIRYIQTIGIVASYPNIVASLCPDISKDKEGLVDFNRLNNLFENKKFASGFLYSPHFMLMAHPYFRRGFHQNANFAPRFIDLFWRLNFPQNGLYILIDYDRVRINVDNVMYMEADTWFGAHFDKDLERINDGIIKLRPPADIDPFLIEFYFADAYSLDIKWETKQGIKSFQAEEFKTERQIIRKNGMDFHPVRYIHAEFDLEKNQFRHFDGAIHFYSADEYFARRDSDFNYNSKSNMQIKSSSEKLFKMNGNISIDTWIEFASHFLAGNPLVIEYFEGKYPQYVVDMLAAVRKNKNK
jgi:hypothetical protein